MKTLIATLLVTATMTTFAFASANSASVFFVGEDFDGNLVTGWISESALDHPSSCASPAPCVNGPHIRSFGLAHGFLGPFGSGAMSSSILGTQNGGAPSLREFVCTTANGGLVACNGQGTFPVLNQEFYQACVFATTQAACYLGH